jgi:hypothetical protein
LWSYFSGRAVTISCAVTFDSLLARDRTLSANTRGGARLALAILAGLGTFAPPAISQVTPSDSASMGLIDPDLAPRPSASATRATGPVSIDGVLDDATWSAAAVISEFWQQKPFTGAPATERTEVRILYDDQNLYIGAELHDQPGYRPIIPTLKRDPNTRDGDAFGVMFDPFLDGKTVFSFVFNPGGGCSRHAVRRRRAYQQRRVGCGLRSAHPSA